MSSETCTDDMYHCPECGFEWGGYDRAPPYANCPKCDDAVMRRGRYTESDEADDYSITVEEDVEPSEDAIDVEELVEEADDWGRELLRQVGATEDEIGEVLRSVDADTEQGDGT